MTLKDDVTVYYIVQNEDKWINQSISIAKNYVDNILVVDTGSKDNTINIVKALDVNLILHGPIDKERFGYIKNDYLETIKTPLVMFVDGDEIVTHEMYQELTHFIPRLDFNDLEIFSILRWEALDITPIDDTFVSVKYISKPNLYGRLCAVDKVVLSRPYGKLRLRPKDGLEQKPRLGLAHNLNKPANCMWHMRGLGRSSIKDKYRDNKAQEDLLHFKDFPIREVKVKKHNFY